MGPGKARSASSRKMPRPPTSFLSERDPKTEMAGTSPAMTFVDTIGFEEVTANFYFFAGAILESVGFGASGLVSGFAAGSAAAWSMRSTLAPSRSFAT